MFPYHYYLGAQVWKNVSNGFKWFKDLVEMCSQGKKRKMVDFKLGEEIRKIQYLVCHEHGAKKKSETPTTLIVLISFLILKSTIFLSSSSYMTVSSWMIQAVCRMRVM